MQSSREAAASESPARKCPVQRNKTNESRRGLHRRNVSLPLNLPSIRRGYRRLAEVRLESFHNCVVAFSRWKCKGQATVNALQKAAALRHQDTDPMCRVTGTVGRHCLFQVCSALRMRGGRCPRLILHDWEISARCKALEDDRGAAKNRSCFQQKARGGRAVRVSTPDQNINLKLSGQRLDTYTLSWQSCQYSDAKKMYLRVPPFARLLLRQPCSPVPRSRPAGPPIRSVHCPIPLLDSFPTS